MMSQRLVDRFIELAEYQLSLFSGNVYEKMYTWCLMLLSDVRLEVGLAKHRAAEVLSNIMAWLYKKGSDRHSILLPDYLEVNLGNDYIQVGDRQVGFLHANVISGAIEIDASWERLPIPPTYISLYKYVSWNTLKLILGNGKLRVSIPRECNDIYEFMPAWESNKERQFIMNTISEMEIVMLCLTRTPNSSVMWGHYAENGTGALLEFRVPVYRLRTGKNDRPTHAHSP